MNQTLISLKNIDKINPESINSYLDYGGFRALNSALKRSPNHIVEMIEESGLRGRGGAGFPTGLKMKFTSEAKSERGIKYVVCNADEGEPGTFKDRQIMEKNPFKLIEGMIIAAYAIGANKAYIYIRGEYHLSISRLKNAILQSYHSGFLGSDILGTDFHLDMNVRLGAGSYLCGEELTLLESLEGKRGHPRIKPPFPAQKGLFQCPTLVNNVETLATLPVILQNGPSWYLGHGVENSSGTKIFNLSGDINNPGSYEFEFGLSLYDLIFKAGGGIPNNKKFKAALLGGAAGTFVDESMLDLKLDYDSVKKVGATLGSGAIIILDDTRNITDFLANVLGFFKHESCGKCTPCRVGTKRLYELNNQLLTNSNNKLKIVQKMQIEAKMMFDTSLCPLGQSPIMPLNSAVKYFEKELTS